MKNKYYVYEHIRLDNNTCFYVGKGCNERAYYEKRNRHHDSIVKRHGMKVKIIKNNLSEDAAFDLEKELIRKYVFELEYSIDIDGYRNRNNSKKCLTNSTWGGEGTSRPKTKEEKERQSILMSGENNPMYGINVWDLMTEEQRKKESIYRSKRAKGRNNPMYNVSPKERMDDNTYKQWRKKQAENKIGSRNPNYGSKTLHNKIKDRPDLRIKYYSRPGIQNGRCVKVGCYTLNDIHLGDFEYLGECAEWVKEYLQINTKINCIRSGISKAIKNNKPYRGLKFKIIE